MSRTRELVKAQAVAPDLALVKEEMDAEEYDMSQHGQEQAPLPDLSAPKHEYDIDIEEHDLLQHPRVRAALQSRAEGSGPFSLESLQACSAGEAGSSPTADRDPALTHPPHSSDTPSTIRMNNVTVEGIRIKFEENSILHQSQNLFGSKVVLRDCGAELRQSGRYCQQCRVQFPSCSALAEHMRPRRAARLPRCDLCQYTTDHHNALKQHVMIHTGEKAFKCGQCDYRSICSSALKLHMKTHTEEKTYQCSQCQYKCSLSISLKNHMSTHSGDMPFQCDHCDYESEHKNNLVTHMMTHAGEKPYRRNQLKEKVKKTKPYSDRKVSKALISIKNGMSVYKASKEFKVPETTLRNKRDGLYNKHSKSGKPPVLTVTEENTIVEWIHYVGSRGFPVNKDQLLTTVAKLVQNLNRPNTFNNGIPGNRWFRGFLKRHPEVSKRVAQNLPQRNAVTAEELQAWFNRVRDYFKKNNMLNVLEDPTRIFNCDETGFFLCPKDTDVLVKRGSKQVYNRTANDEKECLTVLVNASANGDIAPPMVVFPYIRLPSHLKQTVPSWWGLGYTESGWMSMESFFEYIANVFYPWLIEKKVQLPVVLFLDGHTSHVSLPLTTFCKEKGIVLVNLLPNSTHILQPLDVAVFRPIKAAWRKVVREFRVRNSNTKIERGDFSLLVKKCFDISLKPENIKSGFKCCGLYPFDQQQNMIIKESLTNKNQPDDQVPEKEETGLQNEQFTKEFESRLHPDTLQKFSEAGNHWTGDASYEKLFTFWKSLSLQVPIREPVLARGTVAETESNAAFDYDVRMDDFQGALDEAYPDADRRDVIEDGETMKIMLSNK